MNNCKNNVQRKVFKLRSSISVVLSLISIAIVFLIACRHVQQQNTSIDETNKLNFIKMLRLKNQFIKVMTLIEIVTMSECFDGGPCVHQMMRFIHFGRMAAKITPPITKRNVDCVILRFGM